ncbi:dihydrofolate reductase family protein, partial [Bacillus sp. S34]|nr:dihydrofolate reductase family protein [Bacillus sp. S34]
RRAAASCAENGPCDRAYRPIRSPRGSATGSTKAVGTPIGWACCTVAAGLVDEYLVYLAPVLLGGPRVALDDVGVGSIRERRRL